MCTCWWHLLSFLPRIVWSGTLCINVSCWSSISTLCRQLLPFYYQFLQVCQTCPFLSVNSCSIIQVLCPAVIGRWSQHGHEGFYSTRELVIFHQDPDRIFPYWGSDLGVAFNYQAQEGTQNWLIEMHMRILPCGGTGTLIRYSSITVTTAFEVDFL